MGMSVGTAIRNPRTFVSGKWNTFWTVLTDPAEFYEELSVSDRIRRELMALFVVGLAAAAGGYFVARTIMSNFYTGTAPVGGSGATYGVSNDVGIQIWGYGYRGLIGIFVLWVAFGTVAYVLSWLYSDRGSYFGMLKVTAWAMIPLIIGNVIKSITYVVAAWDAWDAETLEVTEGDLVRSAEEVTAFLWEQILGQPVALGGIVVAALFIFWTAYIASYGIADVRDIPREDALKVAAVPTVGYFAYVVYRAATFAGVL